MKYILSLIYILLTTSGLFCFKAGGDSLSLSFKGVINLKIGFVTALGFIFYLCSFLLWQKLVATYNISYIFPLTNAILQVIIVLLGVTYFKESINVTNIIGMILVIVGVVLISIKK